MNCPQFLVKSIALSFLVMMGFVSCNDSEPAKSNESTQKTSTEKMKKGVLGNDSKSYCFRNEYPHEGSDAVDIIELEVNVKNGFANGIYNWLPAEKDQRKGQFRGKMENNVVKGEYGFIQEGTSQTTRIEIILGENEVVVKSPELGLNETIKKVECAN